MTDTITFVAQYGYTLLFFWILCEQSLLPLPSMPLLLAAGALVRAGRLNPFIAVSCCIGAALIADTAWFQLGRRKGPTFLRFLDRVTLSPNSSSAPHTENAFTKYGMGLLLISKLIPGLNAVAAPLAGGSGARVGRFLAFDTLGTLIWIGSYMWIGYMFRDHLEKVAAYATHLVSSLVPLVTGLFAVWILWKLIQRRHSFRSFAKRKSAETASDDSNDQFPSSGLGQAHQLPSPCCA